MRCAPRERSRKRDKILKFEGGFHGMSDYSLMSLAPKRPGNFRSRSPIRPGFRAGLRDEILVAPFNDLEVVASLVREHKEELAGVILEPFQRIIPPMPGFSKDCARSPQITCPADLRRGRDRLSVFAYGGARNITASCRICARSAR